MLLFIHVLQMNVRRQPNKDVYQHVGTGCNLLYFTIIP